MKTVDELIAALSALSPEQRQLPPFISTDDLTWAPVDNVSIQAAVYGQLVLISATEGSVDSQ